MATSRVKNRKQAAGPKTRTQANTQASMEKKAYISLGANSVDSLERLSRARTALGTLPGAKIVAESAIYLTEPQGMTNQPWFHNQAILMNLEASWEAREFLKSLLALEAALGRVRSADPALRYGPRAIDLDLLLFSGVTLNDPLCQIPHPRICERAFVLIPLREIAPDLKIYGKPVAYWLNCLNWTQDGNKIWQSQTTSGGKND